MRRGDEAMRRNMSLLNPQQEESLIQQINYVEANTHPLNSFHPSADNGQLWNVS